MKKEDFKLARVTETEDYFEFVDAQNFGYVIYYCKSNFGDGRKILRDEIIEKLNLDSTKKIFACHQTHSNNVVSIFNDKTSYFEDSDALVTQLSNAVLFTKYADCLPIFFIDKKLGVFGVAHAGWRGSHKKIVEQTLNKMKNDFGSNVGDIVLIFGIGISSKNYEVGYDFYEKFLHFDKEIVEASFSFKDGKIYFDNMAFNSHLSICLGIARENIFVNDLCTLDNLSLNSFRRDGEKSERNCAFILRRT